MARVAKLACRELTDEASKAAFCTALKTSEAQIKRMVADHPYFLE